MTLDQAQGWITTSAVVVAIVYAYRKMVEPNIQTGQHLATKGAAKQLAGQGPPPPLSHWIVAYGFAYMAMSLIARTDPNIGGGLAMLTAVGSVLAQGQQLAQDVTGQQTGTPTAATDRPYAVRTIEGSGGVLAGAAQGVSAIGSPGTPGPPGTLGPAGATGGGTPAQPNIPSLFTG